MNELGQVVDLISTGGWRILREEALAKVAKHEESVKRLLFRTRTPINTADIEYDRGFQQGVMYVLDGLPNTMQAEFLRRAKDGDE